MTEKQKIFADEYLIDLNATRAYRAAYPNCKKDSSADAAARKLLGNTRIQTYITERMEERQKRTEITQDRVLNELAAIAFSNAADYAKVVERQATAEVDGNIIPLVGEDGEPILYRTVELELTDNLTEEQQRALGTIKKGRDGLEQKPCDKVKALELLGRHLGMWNDKLDVAGDMDMKIVVDYGDQGDQDEGS
jgi:phage terminase small subunit|uniref:Terminase small subunit n=1 Tax=Siphoviridae sp. ctuy39 TaxID=2825719 RepID=A0A8S5VEH7_9CAUD|nr:MAG TPA: Terminase small subunit [Siphoviridae sp. ctuy39]